MAFESLTDKLQNVFKNLRSKGRLTEEDVKSALKEVKMALLEADVNFKVVKQFVKAVEERAIGQDVMNGLNPGQMVIKIVNEEMVNLMGSETTEIAMQPGKAITVIMMAGLQGAGKTTATAKIAGKLKLKGKKPLLVACDIYRPAAIEQLQINGKKQEVDVFSMGTDHKPAEIAKEAIAYAEKNGHNVVILDTAGRLHVDEDMMAELQEIKETVTVHQTLLVVDAMTGQDAVNVAKEFDEKVGVDGVILSKMDGDTRGGEFYRTPEQRTQASDTEYKASHMCSYSYFPQYNGTSDDGINANKPDGQAREFFDGLNDDVKEAFQAYGAETYVEMLGTNEAPGEWYPMWSFSNNFNTSTPGGMAWTKIGEVKHEYLPQVVMAADFDKAWADYMDAYNACKPEDFISELQAELDSRMELAAKFK